MPRVHADLENVPSSTAASSRSRAVSLPGPCCLAIFSSPPPSRACARRSGRSSASGRSRLVRLAPVRGLMALAGSSGSTIASARRGRLERRDLERRSTSDAHDLAQQRRAGRVAQARPAPGTAAGSGSGRARRGRGGRRPRARQRAARAVGRSIARRRALQLARARRRRGRARRTSPRARGRSAGVEAASQCRTRRPGTCRRGSRSPSSPGVLKSPWASSHSTRASGRWRATAGSVVTRSSSRRRAAPGTGRRPARRRPGRRPPAGSRASRAGRRRSGLPRGSPGVADAAAPRRRAAAERARAPRARTAVGRAVRRPAQQRDDAASPSVPLGLPLLEERLHALLDVLGRNASDSCARR